MKNYIEEIQKNIIKRIRNGVRKLYPRDFQFFDFSTTDKKECLRISLIACSLNIDDFGYCATQTILNENEELFYLLQRNSHGMLNELPKYINANKFSEAAKESVSKFIERQIILGHNEIAEFVYSFFTNELSMEDLMAIISFAINNEYNQVAKKLIYVYQIRKYLKKDKSNLLEFVHKKTEAEKNYVLFKFIYSYIFSILDFDNVFVQSSVPNMQQEKLNEIILNGAKEEALQVLTQLKTLPELTNDKMNDIYEYINSQNIIHIYCGEKNSKKSMEIHDYTLRLSKVMILSEKLSYKSKNTAIQKKVVKI